MSSVANIVDHSSVKVLLFDSTLSKKRSSSKMQVYIYVLPFLIKNKSGSKCSSRLSNPS